MAYPNIQIDSVTGMPILQKDWLEVYRNPTLWNEATGRDEQGQQRIKFRDDILEALKQAGFGDMVSGNSTFDPQFWSSTGDPYSYEDPILGSILRKTGEREGTRFQYGVGPDGTMSPTGETSIEEMYTNPGAMNKKALMAFGGLLGGGLGANYAMTGSMFNAAAPGAMSLGGAAGGAGSAALGATEHVASAATPFAGMSQAEIAALIESGTVGAEGLALENAAVPGLSGFLNGSVSAAELAAMNGMSESGLGKLFKNVPVESLIKGGATLAGLLGGGAFKSQDGGGGPSARAPFTPSNKKVGQKTYQPNQNNVSEMQRYLDYLAARGNPQRSASGLLGGGSTYYGLLG